MMRINKLMDWLGCPGGEYLGTEAAVLSIQQDILENRRNYCYIFIELLFICMHHNIKLIFFLFLA